ncbi:MAG: bi-domain-containing oxidoreductase [Thermodesulfobacteriota bacterium]|nr:bi-domain-containing oxidoreductase [Thermodesulfobacteriota bacterium]
MSGLKRLKGLVGGRIITWPQVGQVTVEPYEVAAPGKEEVLILVQATAVSPGTERANFNNLPNASITFPCNPGYSGAGEIVQIGPGVSRFRPGDRVAAVINHASIAIIPESQVFKIPPNVSDEEAAFLTMGVIALQALRKASVKLGEVIAVLGQGILGQLLVQLSLFSGGYPITAIAYTEERLEMARRMGATCVIGVRKMGVKALERVEADVTFEATGDPQAIVTATKCTRPGGRIILLGSSRGISKDVPWADIVQRRGISIIGAHAASLECISHSLRDWSFGQEAVLFLHLLKTRQIQVAPLITHRISPWEASSFYRQLSLGKGGIIAAVFQWNLISEEERLSHPSYFSLPKELVKKELVPISRSLTRPGFRIPPFWGYFSVKSIVPAKKVAVKELRRELRVALVGCGEIGITNAQAVSQSQNARLCLVVDKIEDLAKDLGQKYGVPWTTNIEDVWKTSDCEAVLICTPPSSHGSLAIEAIRYGKHVMVEKPMAANLSDAEAMIHAAKVAGVALSICFSQRYLPAMQRAKELLGQGILGKLLGTTLVVHMDKPVSYWFGGYSGRAKSSWRASREESGGGVLISNVIHYIDLLRYLTGEDVSRVYAEYDTLDSPVAVEDSVSLSIRYSSGAIGNISASSCVRGIPTDLVDLRLWGTDGHISLGKTSQFYTLRSLPGVRPGQWHSFGKLPQVNVQTICVDRFAQAVVEGRNPDISGEDGKAAQAIVEAAYLSGRQGGFVAIP